MKIRKFQAASVRDAIAEVRKELGPDAMIIATRQIRRGLMGTGVEVTAATDGAEESETASAPSRGRNANGTATQNGLTDADVERIMAPLRSELRAIRSTIRPLAADRSGEELRLELHALRDAVCSLRTDRSDAHDREAAGVPLTEIARRGVVAARPQRRCIAFVGPTGSGKTTTIAKLAARASLVDRESIAIVSLDTFRVGGEEQIRAYADLIGVPLSFVNDPRDLPQTLASLMPDYDRIFVDTAGRSPRHGDAIDELQRAFDGSTDLEVHLTIPATASGRQIDVYLDHYRPLGVDRLLFTKLDEAEDLSELIRAPIRSGRPVCWIANGQRVPEDIDEASAEGLLKLAQLRNEQERVAA